MNNINDLESFLNSYKTITCDCGKRNPFDVHTNEPVRVVSKCRCGLMRLYYPLDKEEDLKSLRVALGRRASVIRA